MQNPETIVFLCRAFCLLVCTSNSYLAIFNVRPDRILLISLQYSVHLFYLSDKVKLVVILSVMNQYVINLESIFREHPCTLLVVNIYVCLKGCRVDAFGQHGVTNGFVYFFFSFLTGNYLTYLHILTDNLMSDRSE